MSACGKEFRIARTRITSETPTNLTPHVLNRRHIRCRWFVVRGILYKGALALNPRCSRRRRIDEANISTPVAVDQPAANCHSPPCGAGVDRRALTSPSVVHFQFFELFGARRSIASILASLWNCSAAHTSFYCAIEKSSFSKADNPPRSNSDRKVLPKWSASCQVIHSQFGLAIHQNDHQARRRFVEWAQNEIVVVPDFHKRILFSDEAHFWLNGYVNKQNCRIWSEANPQVYVETPLHPEKLTVWCALWAGGIIGPYFFKNDEGHNVTVNGDRYRAMITNFFIPELNNHDVQELWFQQDGVTCHTARATIDLLKDTFGDRLISRFGPVNWPPRSCDLTPLDYFLWGYVKSLVFVDKPQSLDHLEDNIRRVIAEIRPQMLEKVIENWTSRLDYIQASRGSHTPEIIFKM
ncbi:transposable element Tc3 transposase [Trichonephila clavipes]|nr:transposable element Tc3 transposase [Trichonephila clavipes]